MVAAGDWGPFEDAILHELHRRRVPAIVVFNKSDLGQPAAAVTAALDSAADPLSAEPTPSAAKVCWSCARP